MAVVDENLVSQATDTLKRVGATVTTEGLDPDTVNRLSQHLSSDAQAGKSGQAQL